MRSVVNDALRGLDTIGSQLKDRAKTLKQLEQEKSEALAEAWKEFETKHKEHLEVFVRPEGKTFWSQSPRLRDRLGDLSRNLDGAFQAPTQAQRTYFSELKADYAQAIDAVNAFFNQSSEDLNKALAAENIPPLMLPKSIGDKP